MKEEHKILFDRIKIGELELKNRFVLAPMGPGGLVDREGCFNDRAAEFYVHRAEGGTGLLIVGVTYVENEIEKNKMPSMACPTINPLNFIRTSRNMVERIHAHGSKIFLQLTAGLGRVSFPILMETEPVGPSEIPHRWVDGVTCRSLTKDEIHQIVKKFGEAASIAKKAGFDGVEIHALHEGYLLDQFFSSYFNKRTDEYGGSLENRLRFAIEILDEIKNTCGATFPVFMRFGIKSFMKDLKQGALPGEIFEEKGIDIEEGLQAAKLLEAAGYDALDADVGSYDSWYWSHPPMYMKKGMYLEFNEMLKQTVNIPIITAGRMDDPDLASEAIRKNQTDLIAMARPLLADPDIPKKIRNGQYDEIRPCLSCQEGCIGRVSLYGNFSCAVNPACCREKEYGLIPASKQKKIAVVGGGVAGMETARVAAERGHQVVLFEKNAYLGGNIIPGGMPDFKEDDKLLVEWYEGQLRKLNVTVKLNTMATKVMLQEEQPDEVVIATGSIPKKLRMESQKEIYSAEQVLLGKVDTGDSAVVIGGGLVGCELALWLKQKGVKTSIIEYMPNILNSGGPICAANKDMLIDLLVFNDIPIYTNHSVEAVTKESVAIKSRLTSEVQQIEAESVIAAVGYESNKSIYEEIQYDFPSVHLIGDARHVANIMYAIWDAYEIARNL